MELTLYKQTNILSRLLSQLYHLAYWASTLIRIFFRYKHPVKKQYVTLSISFIQGIHFQCDIIIWNLFAFRRELQLEVEQMYVTYWIDVTWWRDRGITWRIGWGLLISTLLSLCDLRLIFDLSHEHTIEVSRALVGGGPLILYCHPAKFVEFYGIENSGVCNISSKSNSNSNAEVLMQSFTKRYFKSFHWCYLRGYIEG